MALEASFETDLRQATKYQNQYQIKTCKWYSVQIDNSLENASEYSVDLAVTSTNPPTPTTIDETPGLRLFAFKILVTNKSGLPVPLRDPIRAIAWTSSTGASGPFQSDDGSDKTILEKFADQVRIENPDIILTFDGNSFDWTCLAKRSATTRVKLDVGRQQGTPHQSLYGHFSITGRGNINLADLARYIYEIKNKTLENLADYFGIPTLQAKIGEPDYNALADESRRDTLLSQTLQEALTLQAIGNQALDYVTQVSALSGLPPDQAVAAAVGFRVDNYLMMEAHSQGQIIPSREEQYAATYKGALVITAAEWIVRECGVVRLFFDVSKSHGQA